MRADFPALSTASDSTFSSLSCPEDASDDQFPVKRESSSSWVCSDLDTYALYTSREVVSRLPPSLWSISQPQITASMRATLADWMAEISMEYGLRRGTYHMSVRLVDQYLSLTTVLITREMYQLVGMAALLVASKFEEVVFPKLAELQVAAGNAYTIEQVKVMEREVLRGCMWVITAPTLYQWTSWLLTQWDDYASFISSDYPRLTSKSELSYHLHRKVMQLVDTTVLDLQHYRFSLQTLAAACVLVVLSETLQTNEFFLLDFEYFLQVALQTQDLSGILRAVQYVGVFLSIPLSLLPPRANLISKVHYADYLSIQTHVPGACNFVKRKIHADLTRWDKVSI